MSAKQGKTDSKLNESLNQLRRKSTLLQVVRAEGKLEKKETKKSKKKKEKRE